jgi:hypothetical protein
MDIKFAKNNCVKAATKWASRIKQEDPDGEGHDPSYWVSRFGYNVFDIIFDCLPDKDWHQYLRLEPDIREELTKLTLDTCLSQWGVDVAPVAKPVVVEPEPVPDLVKVEVVPEPIPAKVEFKPEPVKEYATIAEKMLARTPQDPEQLAKADVNRLYSLSGHPPLVLLIKGGKKFVFKDKSAIIVDVAGARAEAR